MAKITIDNDTVEILRSEDGKLKIEDHVLEHDLIKINANSYHLLVNDRSYRIDIIDSDPLTGNLKLKVNGRTMEGRLSYKIEQVLRSMGMQTGKKVQKDIKAPMPGLVLDVLVHEGDEVNEGDDLIILEAMKMENALKAPQSGTIGSVEIKVQDKVDKNQLLLSYK